MISEAPKQRIQSTAAWIWKQAPRIASAITTLAYSTLAFGQTCAMCYNTASAAKPGAIQALRSGILVLLIPPTLMFIGIFALVFRSKERPEGELGAGGPRPMVDSPAREDSDFAADSERW
jgi:hypothetical protein